MLEAWTVKQLKEAMDKDLQKCNTELERDLCRIICTKEMREFAKGLTRKLTPGEQSILDSL